MGILSGNPQQEPLHYGEIFNLWSNVTMAKGHFDLYQTFVNHCGDKELRHFLQQVIESTIQPAIKQMEQLLVEAEVNVPPTPAQRPSVTVEQIPSGARVQDGQIAAIVASDIGVCLTAYSAAIAQSIREDVGTLFATLHVKKVTDGATLLRLMKEKAWIVPPPLQKEMIKA